MNNNLTNNHLQSLINQYSNDNDDKYIKHESCNFNMMVSVTDLCFCDICAAQKIFKPGTFLRCSNPKCDYDICFSCFLKKFLSINHSVNNQSISNNMNEVNGGFNKEYINLQVGGKRLIRYGSKGGKYYIKNKNKVYIK